MNNLYVFGIGGSGERVVKSLVMMLASGMNVGAQRIIPVFIDNDVKSKAFTECCDLIKYYNATPERDRKTGAHTLYGIHNPDPATWGSFFHTQIAEPIVLNTSGDGIGSLKNVIGYVPSNNPAHSKFDKAIEEEIDLLFTKDDLDMPLSVGFVGNPNIGSIVLNSLSLKDEEFDSIKRTITSQDGVIAVGSLFGGTGAAGLPLIINTFKNLDGGRRPVIGGVAVLPYFTTDGQIRDNLQLDSSKWDVSSDAFLTKTRAALMYYDEHMRLGYDYMYYVGDSEYSDIYEHFRGGEKQKNPYHIIEVMSALSIIDFSKNQVSDNIVYKRPVFGFKNQGNNIMSNISGVVSSDFAKSITKFQIMKKMFECCAKDDKMLKWAIDTKKDYALNIGFNEAWRKSVIGENMTHEQAWGLSNLMKEFDAWMADLAGENAKRQFLLFNKAQDNIDADNITTCFYSDSTFGIANEITAGPFWDRRQEAQKADIANAMQKAFNQLYKNVKPQELSPNATLPMMLNIISCALDEVLKNNCITL